MKIVQSLWTCNNSSLFNFNAGWYAPEYHLISWTLSCLQLKRYHDDVTLYADSESARILIDSLRLPYSNLICNLDKLNDYNNNLWALPKIHIYSLQEVPFLHVDGDVFVWNKFSDDLTSSDLIAQNVEAATNYYENIMVSLEKELCYFPPEILEERKNNALIYAYNAGILGGRDIKFFHDFAIKAMRFISKNIIYLDKINVSNFNIFFEQYLFYCLVKKSRKRVNVLIDQIIGDNEYTGFGDFIDVPHDKQFLHLLGVYKRNKTVCEEMANRLRQDYPEYYYRIIELFKNNRIPLKRDYYHFLNKSDESTLIKRYLLLKAHYRDNQLRVIDNVRLLQPERLPRYRQNILEKALITDNVDEVILPNLNAFKEQFTDVELFEEQLNKIVEFKFAHYSRNYLYARDLDHTSYFQLLFEDKKAGYNIKLTTDNLVEILESKFDWSEIELLEIGKRKTLEQLKSEPSKFFTAIIPECDKPGYSLINIDELDLQLLEMLKAANTINEVLDQIKKHFDPDELEECYHEFELLIIGRIKMALQTKLIKIFFN